MYQFLDLKFWPLNLESICVTEQITDIIKRPLFSNELLKQRASSKSRDHGGTVGHSIGRTLDPGVVVVGKDTWLPPENNQLEKKKSKTISSLLLLPISQAAVD